MRMLHLDQSALVFGPGENRSQASEAGDHKVAHSRGPQHARVCFARDGVGEQAVGLEQSRLRAREAGGINFCSYSEIMRSRH